LRKKRSWMNALDPLQLSWAHALQGETLYFRGAFAQAREHCDEGLVFYDPQQGGADVFLYGHDVRIGSRPLRALALWHLGYPDQAVRGADEALALAQELSHPFTLVFTLHFSAVVHQLCRQVQAVQERAEATGGVLLAGRAASAQGRDVAEEA